VSSQRGQFLGELARLLKGAVVSAAPVRAGVCSGAEGGAEGRACFSRIFSPVVNCTALLRIGGGWCATLCGSIRTISGGRVGAW
jgi:hypothetical protein